MNPEDSKKAIRLLVSLFSGQTITQEQGALLREEFAALSFSPVTAAIKDHRKSHEFLSIPQLLEGCRAAERGDGTEKTETTKSEGSWFDVRRRQNPQYRNRHDVEVALRVYRGWWLKSPRTDAWRKKLANACTVQLLGASPLTEGGDRLDTAGAEEWAMTIFEPPEFFSQCLEQIRDTVPAPFMPESVQHMAGRIAP